MKKNKAQQTSNSRLREARLQRGWTQDQEVDALYDLAIAEGFPELKIDASTISRWECGTYQPQAHHAFLLSKLHNLPVHHFRGNRKIYPAVELNNLPSPLHFGMLEDVKRRNLMLGSFAATATLANTASVGSDRWERLSQALQGSKRIDEAALTSLESETTIFQQLNLEIPPGQLLPYLTAHIDRLSDTLKGTIEPKLRRRLVMTTGEAVELAGWLAWDQGDEASARRFYQIVAAASREADYPSLLACCLADMSYIPSRAGNSAHAQHLISLAMEKLDPDSFPMNYAWLEARQAEELATSGDSRALHLIEQSLHRFSSADPINEAMWTGFLTPERIDNFALNVYLQLGRHQEAAALVKRAIEPNSYNRLKPVILGDIATLYLKTENFEEGTEIAEKAFQIATSAQSKWALGRLSSLYALLAERAPFDQRVAQLVEQFQTFSSG